MRVSDYRDALERVGMLRGRAEGEDNAKQHEFPDVEGCVPPAMKLKPPPVKQAQRLAGSIKDQSLGQLLQAALDLKRVSRQTPSQTFPKGIC